MSEEEAVLGLAVERGKRRCRAVIDGIERLASTSSISYSKITISCKRTLLRLANSDLSFLSRFSSIPNHNPPLSINIGHLEAVLNILQQPFVYGVSRVCKPIPISSSSENDPKTNSCSKGVHVDIVCTLNGIPVWFIVSDRNPKYITWYDAFGNKGLQTRIKHVIDAARSSQVVRPSSVILFFSNGLDDTVSGKLEEELGASKFETEFFNSAFGFSEELEGDWVNVHMRSFQYACVLEIKVDGSSNTNTISRMESVVKGQHYPLNEKVHLGLRSSFCSLVSSMNLRSSEVKDAKSTQPELSSREANLVNFDTTALIALVSGISNGGTEKLLATPENELRSRFKGNFEFVIAQVMAETQSPIHMKLGTVISGKRCIICETVYSEFNELVSMCGGPNEKLRRDHLLSHLIVVPDGPSARMMSLPTTRKLALKNKVVFGTGDYWKAPTLTANMAFVRAISQTGMSLFTIEHEPRALTGD